MSSGSVDVTAVVVPAKLDQLLREVLGVRLGRTTAMAGGFSHLVFRAELVGREPVVVKAATLARRREDLRREAAVLAAWADALDPPTFSPILEALVDDEGWTAVVARPVAVVSHGPSVLADRGADLAQRFFQLGRTLSAVHHAIPSPFALRDSPQLDLRQRWIDVGKAFAYDVMPVQGDEVKMAQRFAVAAAAGAQVANGITLVHGDAGLHNALWGTQTRGAASEVILVDWEHAGLGSPLVDLAWATWTIFFRRLDPATADALFDGYGRGPVRALSWSAERALALVGGQMASLGLRVFPGPGTTEWDARWRDAQRWDPPQA